MVCDVLGGQGYVFLPTFGVEEVLSVMTKKTQFDFFSGGNAPFLAAF